MVLGLGVALAAQAPAIAFDSANLSRTVRGEEVRLGARIGVSVLDTKDGTGWNHRGDERFPLNSTHKVFACAAFLGKVERSEIALGNAVSVSPSVVVAHSPVMEKHLAPRTISLEGVCAASVSHSDNTAANLIIEVIGGPSGLTAFMRRIGDEKTRLDRREPELNQSAPGDVRDTTTPNAIVDSLRRILLGDVLTEQSRALLTSWMVDDKVADALLRSAIPKAWKIADKSGAGGYGSRSIVAVVWPASRPPAVIAIYIAQTAASMPESNAAIARIGKSLVASLPP